MLVVFPNLDLQIARGIVDQHVAMIVATSPNLQEISLNFSPQGDALFVEKPHERTSSARQVAKSS